MESGESNTTALKTLDFRVFFYYFGSFLFIDIKTTPAVKKSPKNCCSIQAMSIDIQCFSKYRFDIENN